MMVMLVTIMGMVMVLARDMGMVVSIYAVGRMGVIVMMVRPILFLQVPAKKDQES